VLTERECRQREAAEPADRFSVDVAGARRWPDVVVDAVDGRRAFEIEFASKGTARLRQIVGAYERSRYGEVRFLVKDAALGRRIASLVRGPSELQRMTGLDPCPVTVLPWIRPGKEPATEAPQRAVEAYKSSLPSLRVGGNLMATVLIVAAATTLLVAFILWLHWPQRMGGIESSDPDALDASIEEVGNVDRPRSAGEHGAFGGGEGFGH